MTVPRLFPVPPWPEGGYPGWPPVDALLRGEFGYRHDFLETDLFREAFWLTADPPVPPAAQAAKVKDVCPTLILDKNLAFVDSIARRVGLPCESDLRDVVAEACARLLAGQGCRSTYDVLCDWHDANVESGMRIRNTKRRAVIRRMVQQPARQNVRARLLVVDAEIDPEVLARVVSGSRGRPIDRPKFWEAYEYVVSRLPTETRTIFEMYYEHRRTLASIVDQLPTSDRRRSQSTVWRALQAVLADILKRYNALLGGDD